MAGTREITVKILGDATSAQRALGSLDDSTAKTESRFNKFGAAMKLAMVGAGIAAVKFGKDSVDAFAESQKVAAQTEAVLKSTGGAANVTADDVSKLAGELQNLSGVEDEAIQSGQNMLLTFTNIKNGVGEGNDVFNQATKTLLDMSVALGTDASTSAVQLGKALNDPIKGISALSRVGVTFTDEQKNTIKTMVEMGDTAGAQKVILAELNKEFGGSAKAAGDARTPMEKLSMQFGEIQEKVGGVLIPVLAKLADAFVSIIGFVSALDPKLLAVIGVVGGLAAVFFTVNAAMGVATAATAAFGITLNLSLLPVTAIVVGVAALAAGLIYAYKHSETFRSIVDGVFRAVSSVVTGFRDTAVTAFDAITGALDTIVSTIRGMPSKISSAASGMWDGIKNAFRSAINFIIDGWNRIEFSIPGFKVGPVGYDGFKLGVPDIPRLAAGGIVQARSGGTLALLGEGGRDEAVIPLPRGGGVATAPAVAPVVNVHVAGSVVSEHDLVDSVYQGLLKLRRRNGDLGLA